MKEVILDGARCTDRKKTCAALALVPQGGPKSCSYGCIGCGDCIRMCEYGAISIERGVAKVDEEKCLDCRKCMNTCPKGIIVEVPYFRAAHIGCMNRLPKTAESAVSPAGNAPGTALPERLTTVEASR